MPGLTVSESIFAARPDSFIKEHISQILIQQFNKSHKIESINGFTAFCFYTDHAFIITSNKEREIYSYQHIYYDTMLPDSFIKSLNSHSCQLPSHWQIWLTDSLLELIRKEIVQSLNFNRLKASYILYENLFSWNWKSHDISFQMNSSYIFNDIKCER
ncbi:hypothetical protein D3C87_1337790 [compost metagenome]